MLGGGQSRGWEGLREGVHLCNVCTMHDCVHACECGYVYTYLGTTHGQFVLYALFFSQRHTQIDLIVS